MKKIKNRVESQIKDVIREGSHLLKQLAKEKPLYKHSDLIVPYQCWYTRAQVIVKEFVPNRLDEFEWLYAVDNRGNIDIYTYSIKDYLFGLSFTNAYDDNLKSIVFKKLTTQLSILTSAISQIDNILNNLKALFQLELLDNEIDAAHELFNANHLRAAGTIAGVVLECHLLGICNSRKLNIKKRNPSISELNDKLKKEGVIDIPTWRRIQHLGDLRNYCCHHKERDPTKDEVEELINSVEKVVKTIN